MPGSSEVRKKLRTWVALPLVLFYAACLLVASLPREMMPRDIARATGQVRRFLGILGIYPGYAVFADEEPAADIPLSYCARVSGKNPGRPRVDIFFPEPECPVPYFRWRILPLQRPLYRIMYKLEEPMSAANELLIRDLMRFYCRSSYPDGTPVERATLVWWLWSRDYYTLVETRRTVNYLEFDCRKDSFSRRLKWPTDEEVIDRYGGAPWEP